MHDYPDPSVELLVNRLKTALDEQESVKDLESELAEARNEIQRILKHSHQVQESLEQVFHDDQAKRCQIEEIYQQISKLLSDQHEAEAQDVEALDLEFVTPRQHLSEKSVELEVIMRELERFFDKSRQLRLIVDKYEILFAKCVALIQACSID